MSCGPSRQEKNESEPAYGGNNVYFGSSDHMLYTVNVDTGQEMWKYVALYGIRSGPAYSNGVVYVGTLSHKPHFTNSGSVITVDAVMGAER